MGFDPRPLVRKLGRPNARPLERDEASALFDAMLDGTLDDVQLGAAWMGLRIKGETPDELTAFLESAERSYSHWEIGTAPAGTLPVVIPSYNGARQLANLTPLLAMLLARSDINIIVHGVDDDPENAESTDPARGTSGQHHPSRLSRSDACLLRRRLSRRAAVARRRRGGRRASAPRVAHRASWDGNRGGCVDGD